MSVTTSDHGTPSRYASGCRCEPCREGKSAYNALYRERNRARIAAQKARRRAEMGDAERARDRERYAANATERLEQKARYYVENKTAIQQKQRTYRETNREKVLRLAAEQRERRRPAAREYAATWRAENAEKLRAWRRSPEGRASSRAYCRRRRERARLLYCGCDTRENLAAVWALDSGRCAYCNAPGTDYEHVVPLSRGGWGCVSNFRVACKSCNSRKGTHPLSVFLFRLAASGVEVREGATNSGLPCPAAAARMAVRMLPPAESSRGGLSNRHFPRRPPYPEPLTDARRPR